MTSFRRARRVGRVAAVLAVACAPAALANDSSHDSHDNDPGLALARAADLAASAPATEVCAAQPLRVRSIRAVPENIFDLEQPGENNFVFRWADRLHRTTRPAVIERQVLLAPGDLCTAEAAAESERLLRANSYLRDATLRAIPAGSGEVDLAVVTRDVWTLQGGIGFRRSGGANDVHFEIQDANFLGTGKDIVIGRETSVDRTSNLFEYRDPALFGTRGRLDLTYADSSDGQSEGILLERPFYALDTRWALGVDARSGTQVDSFYRLGHVRDRFAEDRDELTLYGGRSRGLVAGAAQRWRAGFTYERSRFSTVDDPLSLAPGELPQDRTLSYPWVSWERVDDAWITARDLDRIRRTEDVHVGREAQVRLGLSLPALGADSERVVLDGSGSLGWRPTSRQLWLATLEGGGRFGGAGSENLLVGARLRWYLRDVGDNVFYVGIEGQAAHALDAERQLLIGGDSGLRGYPLRYLEGDRRALLTVEQRWYGHRELFHLLNYGAAAFFDVGSAWWADTPPSGAVDRRQLLRDVGIGLRLGSSRSSRGAMVHFDLAFPLDGGSDISKVQWLVSTVDKF